MRAGILDEGLRHRGRRRQEEGRDVEGAHRALPDDEQRDGEQPRRQPVDERDAVHCRAFTICARNSCTMSWNSVREGHFEIARPRQFDAALDQDAARPRRHHEDAVGEEHRLAQIVRHQDHGDLARRVQVADHAPQLLAGEGIERAERLVEHQQLRLVDQRAAQRGALLHAAGQLPGKLVALIAQAHRARAGFARARRIRRACGAARGGAAARSRAAAADCPASCARAAASAPGTPCRRS